MYCLLTASAVLAFVANISIYVHVQSMHVEVVYLVIYTCMHTAVTAPVLSLCACNKYT